jgi:hypothetical protein
MVGSTTPLSTPSRQAPSTTYFPCNGAALATRNTKDFADTGVTVLDPWEPSLP